MDWLVLNEIPGKSKDSKVLQRQREELIAFRQKVETPEPEKPNANPTVPNFQFYGIDELENEALRRELIFRVDLVKHLQQVNMDPMVAVEKGLLEQVRKLLDDRGGHR